MYVVQRCGQLITTDHIYVRSTAMRSNNNNNNNYAAFVKDAQYTLTLGCPCRLSVQNHSYWTPLILTQRSATLHQLTL